MITPFCFSPICKMSCLFLSQLNIQNIDMFFSAWGPETKEQIKLAKYYIRFKL